ncbi:MAG: hypothetical protein LBM74_04095 [Oscillospiraceae bacterium]|jgi:hypothetical protein|nr:hypothetical protein [Oscillospiraceae bacterium]
MRIPLSACRWQGSGLDLPARMPGMLAESLAAAGVVPDPAVGLNARAGEWAALRPWQLAGDAAPAALAAERIFLCARGVRGRGQVLADGQAVGAFGAGDWDMELTGALNGREKARVALQFAPQMPEGFPPRPVPAVGEGLALRGVSQLRLLYFEAVPEVEGGAGLLTLTARVRPYVSGKYVFQYTAMCAGELLASAQFAQRLGAADAQCSHRMALPVPRLFRPGEENEPIRVRLTITRAGLLCDEDALHTIFREAAAPPPRLFALWHAEEGAPSAETLSRRLRLLRDAGIAGLWIAGAAGERLREAANRAGMVCEPARACGQRVSGYMEPDGALGLFYDALRAEGGCAGADALTKIDGAPCGVTDADSADTMAQVGFAMAVAQRSLHKSPCADGGSESFNPLPQPCPAIPCIQQGSRDGAPCGDAGSSPVSPKVQGEPALHTAPLALAIPAMPPVPQTLSAPYHPWPPTTPLWADRAKTPFPAAWFRTWLDSLPPDAPTAARLTRLLQAETLRLAVESARMNDAPLLLEGVFDAVPALHSPALFDAGDAPRPAYWALRAALRPLRACALLDRPAHYCGTALSARIALLCAAPALGPLSVTARLHAPNGQVLAETAFDHIAPETAVLGEFCAPLPDEPCMLLLRLTVKRLGALVSVDDYPLPVGLTALLKPLYALSPARLCRSGENLRNASRTIAFGVATGGWLNPAYPPYGAILPGENRQIRQDIAIEGWNLDIERIAAQPEPMTG